MSCPHCETKIDEHDASRCLDAWVAEAVMGDIHTHQTPTDFGVSGHWWKSSDGETQYGHFPPNYSTDIAATWEVVEKLADDNWIISVGWGNGRDGRKYASIQMSVDLFLKADLLHRPITQMDAKALTAPLAICRAALKAIYVGEDGK